MFDMSDDFREHCYMTRYQDSGLSNDCQVTYPNGSCYNETCISFSRYKSHQRAILGLQKDIQELRSNEQKSQNLYNFANGPFEDLGNANPPAGLEFADGGGGITMAGNLQQVRSCGENVHGNPFLIYWPFVQWFLPVWWIFHAECQECGVWCLCSCLPQ